MTSNKLVKVFWLMNRRHIWRRMKGYYIWHIISHYYVFKLSQVLKILGKFEITKKHAVDFANLCSIKFSRYRCNRFYGPWSSQRSPTSVRLWKRSLWKGQKSKFQPMRTVLNFVSHFMVIFSDLAFAVLLKVRISQVKIRLNFLAPTSQLF